MWHYWLYIPVAHLPFEAHRHMPNTVGIGWLAHVLPTYSPVCWVGNRRTGDNIDLLLHVFDYVMQRYAKFMLMQNSYLSLHKSRVWWNGGDGEVQDSKGILNLEACIDETHIEPRRAKSESIQGFISIEGCSAVHFTSSMSVCVCVRDGKRVRGRDQHEGVTAISTWLLVMYPHVSCLKGNKMESANKVPPKFDDHHVPPYINDR